MPLAILGIDWTMELVYMACAAAGGAVLVLQTVLLLFGVGDGHADVDLHHGGDVADGSGEGHDGAFGLLSVRAVASFFTIFGLVGWLGVTQGWRAHWTVMAAVGSGLAVMLLVAWLIRAQMRLQSRGNLEPANAVGQSARVYLRVPAKNAGFGKVTLKLQGRTAEFAAFTSGAELATGALVRIVRMSTPDTFEVEALREERQEERTEQRT
jgi:hypothetical protein